MKHIGYGIGLIFLVGLVMLFGLSCSLVFDGCGKHFTREQCDDPYWISQVGDSYSYSVRSSIADVDSITIEFKGFCGRDTVWELISNSNVRIPYELDISDVHAQAFKVVLIHEGTGVIKTIYRHGADDLASISLTPGKHTIKIIGYGAQGRLSMKLNVPLGVLAIERFSERW